MSLFHDPLVCDPELESSPSVRPVIDRYRALYAPDRAQSSIVSSLHDLIELSDASRASLVWTDRDAPRVPHPSMVVDRELRPAPTAYPSDLFDTEFGNDRALRRGSCLRIDAGGDGSRTWSVVLEGIDHSAPDDERWTEAVRTITDSLGSIDRPSVLWGILSDLEGRESDLRLERSVRSRLAVADHVRMVVDHGFVDRKHLVSDGDRILETLPRGRGASEETVHWRSLLMALREPNALEVGAILLTWGEWLESARQLRGALEILKLAYRATVYAADAEMAIDAARFCGRVNRELSQFEAAFRWYGFARDIAIAADRPYLCGLVIDGIGNTHRDRGNHPKARAAYQELLQLGHQNALPELVGRAHHGLLVLENLVGERMSAATHGWAAVESYPADSGNRVRVLFDLGAVLLDLRVFDLSETAFRIVPAISDDPDLRIYSLVSRAEIAAHQGDRTQVTSLLRQADEDTGEPTRWVQAQMCITRGTCFELLDDRTTAREWYERGRAMAEEFSLYQVLHDAIERLSALDSESEELRKGEVSVQEKGAPSHPSVETELDRVRRGLVELEAAVLA